MANKKFSHVRIRRDGVTFAGKVRSKGEIVPIMTDGMESVSHFALDEVCRIIQVTKNLYIQWEAGRLAGGGSEFAPLKVGGSDTVTADPVPYEPVGDALPIIDLSAEEEPEAEEELEAEEEPVLQGA